MYSGDPGRNCSHDILVLIMPHILYNPFRLWWTHVDDPRFHIDGTTTLLFADNLLLVYHAQARKLDRVWSVQDNVDVKELRPSRVCGLYRVLASDKRPFSSGVISCEVDAGFV